MHACSVVINHIKPKTISFGLLQTLQLV